MFRLQIHTCKDKNEQINVWGIYGEDSYSPYENDAWKWCFERSWWTYPPDKIKFIKINVN